MADDQNQSNKPPTNQLSSNNQPDTIDYSEIMTGLERIQQRNFKNTSEYVAIHDRRREAVLKRIELRDVARQEPNFKNSPVYIEGDEQFKKESQRLRNKMNGIDAGATARSESEASTLISRHFNQSSVNKRVGALQRQQETQTSALGMVNMPYEELESQRQDMYADLNAREREAQSAVKGGFSRKQVDPQVSTKINTLASAEDTYKRLATIQAAETMQRAAGKDPMSKFRELGSMWQTAEGINSAKQISKEVSSSKIALTDRDIDGNAIQRTIRNKDVNPELEKQANNLTQALAGLADQAGKSKDELSKLRKQADDSAGNMKKLQEAQKAQGGGSNWNAGNVASGLASGFNTVGAAAQQIMVSQRMQQVANVAGAANFANEQYDMYSRARGGDIASQLALTKLDASEEFGSEMKLGTNIALGAYAAGGLAQVAAGGIRMAEGGVQKFNPLAYAAGTSTNNTNAIIEGATNAIGGLATTATTGFDLKRQVSGNAAKLAGQSAALNAQMAMQAVAAKQMQGLRDYYTTMDVVAQGSGSNASAFLKDTTSVENINRMTDARMSPEQFAKLAQQGLSTMGSTFDKEQIYASRNLEQRGFGNMSENMQRMATLAGAGANNPKEGMENVLSAAVTKGLDTSKSISMMVENTASIVSASAGAAVGVDTTAAASSLLAHSMNPEMKNKEFALQQAMTAADITRAATTDRGVSFTGMANTAGLQNNLAKAGINVDGIQALSVQGVDMATLKSLQNDPKKAAEFFQNKGVNVTEGNADKFLETVMTEKERQVLRQGGLASGFDLEGLRTKARSGNIKEGSEEFRQLGQIAELQGRKGGAQELIREIKGVGAPNVDSKSGQTLTGKPGDADDLKSQLDALRTSGFKQLGEAAETAAGNLEKFGGAVKVFLDLQETFEKNGKNNESEFAQAGAKMATDFNAAAVKFEAATTTYADASQAIIMASKVIANSSNKQIPPELQKAMDKLNVRKDGKGG